MDQKSFVSGDVHLQLIFYPPTEDRDGKLQVTGTLPILVAFVSVAVNVPLANCTSTTIFHTHTHTHTIYFYLMLQSH
jgi:hypothetical protein